MEKEKIIQIAEEMLKTLVNCLGLDGERYISANKKDNSFFDFGDADGLSMFLTAESNNLKNYLEQKKLDEKTKKYKLSEGLIVINQKYKNMPPDDDLFIKVIHEMLHSNRMLLINSQHSDNKNISSIFYDNNHFVQNSNSNRPYYADASQDILKGSIDNSKKAIEKYSNMSDEEKEDISFANPEYEDKMEQQRKIDDALVETMAIVAHQLYTKKTKNIMPIIKDINERYGGDDIHAITSIILRHNDLELFRWMLDPLSYQIGDINYDYFSHYLTAEDMADYQMLIESEEIMFNDDEFDDYIISSRGR